MNAVLLYLLETTLCLVVLFPVYWFFLRKDTFYQVNRFYLLSMVIFSMILPLLPMHFIASGPPSSWMIQFDPVLITPSKVQHTLSAHMQWIELAAVVYFSGVLVFFLRFGIQLLQLQRITRRFGIRERKGQKVVFIDRGYSPFSFFRLVFINEEVLPQGSLQTILEHERVHIRQYHSLDMILLKIATILQWFNPIIWLTGREMKILHEYLADEGVLQSGISPSRYQQMILDETLGIHVNSLTNNFNVSILKKRITMMTKPKSGNWAISKMLIALPALASLLFLLPTTSVSNSTGKATANENQEVMFVKSPEKSPVETVFTPQDKPAKTTGSKVYERVEKYPEYPGGDEARIKFLTDNIKYPESAVKAGIQGKVFVNFVVEADGRLTHVKILRGIDNECDQEAVRVVKLMPKWIPGMDKGKKVAVSFVVPINFVLEPDKGKKKEDPKE